MRNIIFSFFLILFMQNTAFAETREEYLSKEEEAYKLLYDKDEGKRVAEKIIKLEERRMAPISKFLLEDKKRLSVIRELESQLAQNARRGLMVDQYARIHEQLRVLESTVGQLIEAEEFLEQAKKDYKSGKYWAAASGAGIIKLKILDYEGKYLEEKTKGTYKFPSYDDVEKEINQEKNKVFSRIYDQKKKQRELSNFKSESKANIQSKNKDQILAEITALNNQFFNLLGVLYSYASENILADPSGVYQQIQIFKDGPLSNNDKTGARHAFNEGQNRVTSEIKNMRNVYTQEQFQRWIQNKVSNDVGLFNTINTKRNELIAIYNNQN